MTLPVCWCGDPATYALDAHHPVGVAPAERAHVWERDDAAPVLVAARCRAHAGPFAAEVTTGKLVPVQVYPLGDELPWDADA